jgi:hypothetical protein
LSKFKFLKNEACQRVAANVRAWRSAEHLKNVQPEPKPIKDTKVENIFYSSSMFRQLDMQPIVAKVENIFVTPPYCQTALAGWLSFPIDGRVNLRS